MNRINLPKILKSKTPKVYKNKKLNNANFGDFSLNNYQVFLHLASKIGGVDENGKYIQPKQLERKYILTAKEFSEVFNTDLSHSYKLLYNVCKKLTETSLKLEKPELSETWWIPICSIAKYNENKGYIEIEFADKLMPYLAQVKEKFVLYNLKEISNFRSFYTTRLYELIKEFQETGWMLKSVDRLREIFAVGNKFKAYKDFKINTFVRGCDEINDHYDMNLKFEEIKEGRKVVAVKFTFNKSVIVQRMDQKGNTHNTYVKPKGKKVIPKILKVLEGQLPLY